MKKGLWFALGLLAGLFVSALILIGVAFGWQVTSASSPESLDLPPAQVPANLQSQVDDLSRRVDKLENDQFFTLRDIEWKLDQKLYWLGGIALGILLALGAIGIKTYNDLEKLAREKVQTLLDEALFDLNPSNIPVYLPAGENMEEVHRRLQLSGFKNVSFYNGLEHAPEQGVILVSMPKGGEKEKQKEFQEFIARKRPNPVKTAFILYAAPQALTDETMHCYENLVAANFPATAASMVLVVGRGLRIKENLQ